MARAYSPHEILQKKYRRVDWTGKWVDAFDNPELSGIWVACGHSGNGKSTLIMQMVAELAKKHKVFFNALEEGTSLTLQNTLRTSNIYDVRRNVLIGNESMNDMTDRLLKKKSPQIAIVDSAQYAKLTWRRYTQLKETFAGKKLIIFTSHAEGKHPRGDMAKSIWYDAGLKLWVEGYKAISNGRYNPGGELSIWEEGANKYHGSKTNEY